MEIKLSIIIPVYNTIQYLENCINSVLKLELKNYEIILVDDESPDNAGKLCDEYSHKYPFIVSIHKKNEGLGSARNSGLDVAKGKYISFLDSDDFVKKNYYERLIEECEINGADICYAGGIIKYKENTKDEQIEKFVVQKNILQDADIKINAARVIASLPKKNDGLSGSSCLSVYKSSFLKKNDIKFISEREFVSEDVWFNLDCYVCASKIVYSNVIGYCYRYNSLSLSRKYNPNRFSMLIQAEKMLVEKCNKEGIDGYEDRIAVYFWNNFEKCLNQEVRYRKDLKKSYHNIVEMCKKKEVFYIVKILNDRKLLVGLHNVLCWLVYKQLYAIIIIFLKIYNILLGR